MNEADKRAERFDRSPLGSLCYGPMKGSPRERETDIIAALERLQADSDKGVRRQARRVMAHYRRHGSWNIL